MTREWSRHRPRVATLCAILAILAVANPALSEKPSPVPPVSPVQATLVAPESKVLPGVPFEMWVEIRNASDATVGVGLCADMIVTPDGAEPFTISFGRADSVGYPTLLPDADGWGHVSYVVLRPHEAETLTLPLGSHMDGPAYFRDYRLSGPGVYRIALRLDYCWPGGVIPQKSLLPPEFLGSVTTNQVAVERITPSGSDAKVWQRMQQLANGKWRSTEWDHRIVGEIVADHRDSNYYPYALVASSLGAVDVASYERFVDAIRRFPDTPVLEILELNARGISVAVGKGMAAYRAHHEKLKQSKRPTTRILAFGRENAPTPPCPANHVCED